LLPSFLSIPEFPTCPLDDLCDWFEKLEELAHHASTIDFEKEGGTAIMATLVGTDRGEETSEDCEENEVGRFGSWRRTPSREIKLGSPTKSSIHSFDGVRGPRETRVGLGPWGGQKRRLDCGVGWNPYILLHA
jgi:hypothetical protein